MSAIAQEELVAAYVPDGDLLTFREAHDLALERDANATEAFLMDVPETQLNMRAAAKVVQPAPAVKQDRIGIIIRELGFG